MFHSHLEQRGENYGPVDFDLRLCCDASSVPNVVVESAYIDNVDKYYSGAQITRKQISQSFTIPKVPFLSQLFILYVKMTHLTQSSSFQKEFSVSLQFRVRCAPLYTFFRK